jgi:hypothetical protein
MLKANARVLIPLGLVLGMGFTLPGLAEKPPAANEKADGADLPWAIKPDPGAAKIQGPFDLKGSIPVAFMGEVLFPTAPSPFVMVTPVEVKDRSMLRMYDLRTLKPIGEPLRGKFDVFKYMKMTASPDGAYLATIPNRMFGETTIVEVWSTATGRLLHTIEIDENPKVKAGLIEFAGKDRLLVMKHEGQFVIPETRTTYELWDLKTGKRASQFTLDFLFSWKWGGWSPGRKHMILAGNGTYHMYVYELDGGKLTGEFPFQKKDDAWGQGAGITFSPDGKEVAMLWRLGKKPNVWGRLLCWDVATHKKLFDHPINYDVKSIDSLWSEGGPRVLQWWPERSGWLLFGHLLIDRESGAVVHKLGPEPAFHGAIVERRFLDADHVTTIEGPLDPKLRIIALPRAEIDAAVKKARAH